MKHGVCRWGGSWGGQGGQPTPRRASEQRPVWADAGPGERRVEDEALLLSEKPKGGTHSSRGRGARNRAARGLTQAGLCTLGATQGSETPRWGVGMCSAGEAGFLGTRTLAKKGMGNPGLQRPSLFSGAGHGAPAWLLQGGPSGATVTPHGPHHPPPHRNPSGTSLLCTSKAGPGSSGALQGTRPQVPGHSVPRWACCLPYDVFRVQNSTVTNRPSFPGNSCL